jgi:hypothetical protein
MRDAVNRSLERAIAEQMERLQQESNSTAPRRPISASGAVRDEFEREQKRARLAFLRAKEEEEQENLGKLENKVAILKRYLEAIAGGLLDEQELAAQERLAAKYEPVPLEKQIAEDHLIAQRLFEDLNCNSGTVHFIIS